MNTITKKDVLLFLTLWVIFSLIGYFFIFKKEAQENGDNSFIIHALIAASAVIVVPIIKSIIKNIRKR